MSDKREGGKAESWEKEGTKPNKIDRIANTLNSTGVATNCLSQD